jgi:hypothetical protein
MQAGLGILGNCLRGGPALQWRMPELTRRRSPDAREGCWLIFYGDVRVGTISKRVGVPRDQAPWGWSCGFYPGSHPGECTTGTAATLDQARADFEAAWRIFLAKRTEADFQAWRDQQEWTEQKYPMWKRGERLPAQRPNSLMTCPCGQMFDSHRLEDTVIHVPHITASAIH